MSAYYNEFDPDAAKWLRELIRKGLIADGDVDDRSIEDVKSEDLKGYTQVHFFAGIGGWSAALRLAVWADDRPVWTGSCPCQDFSCAGKGEGHGGARNLWPAMFWLIRECRPECVIGEQVEAAIRYGWLDGISTDLEGAGYTVGSAVLGAHSVQAPHRRQRLFWVADTADPRHSRARQHECGSSPLPPRFEQCGGGTGSMADAESRGLRTDGTAPGSDGHPEQRVKSGVGNTACTDKQRNRKSLSGIGRDGASGRSGDASSVGQSDGRPAGSDGGVGDADRSGLRERCGTVAIPAQQPPAELRSTLGFWSSAEWLLCQDAKSRRVEPSIFPLAHGIPYRQQDPLMGYCIAQLEGLGYSAKAARRLLARARNNRVVRLSGAGNAIVPQVAAEFIRAYMDVD